MFLINTGPVGVLRLTAVQPEDRGLYTCLAKNVHGSSEESNAGLLTLSGDQTWWSKGLVTLYNYV